MGRCRFVQPEVVRLPLSDGEYVDVKKQLNAGEQRRVFTRLVKAMHLGEKTDLDPDQVGRSKLAEYIVDWSFNDLNGNRVPFSEAALDNLDPDTYAEIAKAIDVHEEHITTERDARKNAQAGETPSPATSASVA